MVGGFCWLMSNLLLVLLLSKSIVGINCFENCKCLGENIDCSHKSLTSIPNDIPNWVKELNLNSNRIHHLDKKILNNLTRLVELKLNKNKLTNLTNDTFKHQKQLKILEINRNQIENFQALSFTTLEKLTVLKLKRNNIRSIPDGTFWGLKNIKILELDYNHITAVSKTWAYGLSHLQELTLSNNLISQIDTEVWEFCKNLIFLNLASNKLGSLQKSTFKYLSYLERLNLNNNSISHIEESTFTNTPNLKILWLNSNKLSWTVEDPNQAFIGLNNLEKFHLASNDIKSIHKNAFLELQNVTMLDLSNNNITTLQHNAFEELRNLKELVLNSSNLLCDCNLHWFAAWLRKNTLTRVHAVCAYPLWLRGKHIGDVSVHNFTCDDVPKPRLVEEPQAKMALKGENVSLYCKAVSSSSGLMQFMWKRDNIELQGFVNQHPIVSPDSRSMEYASELQLFNVLQSDQGKYQCVVTNSFGTTYSQKARLTVLIYPKFSKEPQNMTLNAGDMARLECAAYGEPQPQIAWQKDGGNDFPAARERRMHIMPTDDVFYIKNVKTVDMGVYSCTAQNPAGVVVANATLTVFEMPSFVKPMENKEIMAGNPIVLECMASGSPKPMLTWLKDGDHLRATERHFFTAENQLMIIVDTTLSDAGKYECVMNNSLGSVRGSSLLEVLPGATVNDDDMMGIIIISVVCCALGTSIVWVVIIYQTRRRVTATVTNHFPMNDMDTPRPRVYVDGETDQAQHLNHHQTDLKLDHNHHDNDKDTSSEHSSCKDSGTGDSAKHSSISDNFTLLSERENVTELQMNGIIQSSQSPLLYSNNDHPRLTNHDRDRYGNQDPNQDQV